MLKAVMVAVLVHCALERIGIFKAYMIAPYRFHDAALQQIRMANGHARAFRDVDE
jgi:hypothetical protein